MIGHSTYYPPFSSTRSAPSDPWMTVPEIAVEARVSRMTVYRAIEFGHLESQRFGRSIRVRTTWFLAWQNNGALTMRTDEPRVEQ